MPLASGAQLGPYEILAPLGAGGIGEVYRAKDTRIGRSMRTKRPGSIPLREESLVRFRGSPPETNPFAGAPTAAGCTYTGQGNCQ